MYISLKFDQMIYVPLKFDKMIYIPLMSFFIDKYTSRIKLHTGYVISENLTSIYLIIFLPLTYHCDFIFKV